LEKPLIATPVTQDDAARRIVAAYAAKFGHAPTREEAELLTALVFLENAHGSAVIQHNWGNVSTFVKPTIDYWRPPWFDLDAVNALPDGPKKNHLLFEHAEMLAHRAPQAFLAFDSHEQGLKSWLANVKPSMYEAARAGDPMGFAHAYWASGYCPDEACRNSGPTFAKLQAQIRAAGYFSGLASGTPPQSPPAAGGGGGSGPSGSLLEAAFAVGLALGAAWLAETFGPGPKP